MKVTEFDSTKNTLLELEDDDVIHFEKRSDGTLVRVLCSDKRKYTMVFRGKRFHEALEGLLRNEC